jgi:uncharacterized OsmC-like protein
MDLRGALGLSDECRNGFERVQVNFEVEGDASPETLQELVNQAQRRSAVFDIVAHGVPVSVALASVTNAVNGVPINGTAD